MKKSLSHQFVAILLIPIIIILATNYGIVSYIYNKQTESLKNYCDTNLDNVAINLSSMTSSMKKTATMFASNRETQEYLLNSSTDTQPLQLQSFFDLIGLSRAYTPDLVDIIIWNRHSPTSMISYIPADMENFTVDNFQNDDKNTASYFEFYLAPITLEPYLVYFTPVSMTTFSENFGEQLGNIAIICKTSTLNKLMNSTANMDLNITDSKSGQIIYKNNYSSSSQKTQNEFYKNTQKVTNTNLAITGIIYNRQIGFFRDAHSKALLLLALLSAFYVIYIAFAVHHVIIRPIYNLNAEIASIDYEHDEIQIHTSLKNEIGSIASHVNILLSHISSLNRRNIASQARLYEMELNKKQTQLYAYQSQINPHFLYNMLQCMRGISLMHGIPEVAQICTNMAALFRYSIKGNFLVPLKDELNIIDKYLYMIRVRFQNRIMYELDIAEDTKSCRIPKIILQPIVENAIFHGLEEIEDNGTIHIRTFRNKEDLIITVQDNGIGFEPEVLKQLKECLDKDVSVDFHSTFDESKGLGILNIHNKIRLYEGSGYGISIESSPGHTVVTLCLNAAQPDTIDPSI